MSKLIMLKGSKPIATTRYRGPGLKKSSKVETEIVVVDATKDAFDEARRSDEVVAFGKAMPLKLIAPRAASAQFDDVATANKNGFSWGLEPIGALRSNGITGEGVTVAVLDTGICSTHVAFPENDIKIISKNFTTDVDEDTDGHGTHCAGTIFGRDVNGTRIGVAPGIKRALIGKVIGDGAGTESLLEAFQWALNEKANVISMSLGFDFVGYREALVQDDVPREAATSEALETFRENIRLFDALMQINRAQESMGRSAIVIAASGNESDRFGIKPYVISRSSPSAAEGVISVGAVMRGKVALDVAGFSNSNPSLVAPGVGIVSAQASKKVTDGLVALDGTSMACPHVAGLAALHWQAYSAKAKTPSLVTPKLLSSCEITYISGNDQSMQDVGRGLVQAP